MSDSILDEFERAHVSDGMRRAPFRAVRLRCVAVNAKTHKACKGRCVAVHEDRAYCVAHLGMARRGVA